MRRQVLGSLLVAGAVAGPAVAEAFSAGSAPITVKPRTGGPHTRFVISFSVPQSTGRFGGLGRRYILGAAQSRLAPGCVSDVSVNLPDTRAHALMRVTLAPRRFGQRWCTGSFRGQIEELQAPVCFKGKVCPAYVALIGTVGRFAFRVKATRVDTTAPTFAGLQRAFACTPGPQRPGQTTPFTLNWRPATDTLTPSAKLVYDVYEAASPEGESFSKPTWITPPGATMFRTPGLPSHGNFYFVVRARDQTGNEDSNRVERRGVDPCL